jgi:hypothetical protein
MVGVVRRRAAGAPVPVPEGAAASEWVVVVGDDRRARRVRVVARARPRDAARLRCVGRRDRVPAVLVELAGRGRVDGHALPGLFRAADGRLRGRDPWTASKPPSGPASRPGTPWTGPRRRSNDTPPPHRPRDAGRSAPRLRCQAGHRCRHAPVGVSGDVPDPVQLSVFRVPHPSVTPTNLQLNVIAAPGALLRYRLADRPVAAAAAPDPRLSASGWGEGHRGSS